MATGLMPEFGLNIVNLYAPAGTRIPMQQTTAPLGWTVDGTAALDDAIFRCRNNAGSFGTGGSNGVSGTFLSAFSINAFTISTAQMPSHTHTDSGHSHPITDPSHGHTLAGGNSSSIGPYMAVDSVLGSGSYYGTNAASTGITGTNTGAAQIQANGSGAAIQPTVSFNIKYVDYLVAVKS
jgi:hypothetical protein